MLIVLNLLTVPARAQTALSPVAPGDIFAAALRFMAPRILQPVPLPQLCLWGLRGLTALDPALTPDVTPTEVRVMMGNRLIFAKPAPTQDDATGWGLIAGNAAAAAAQLSAPVRQAKDAGVVRSFFDELFNHLDPYSRYVPPDDAQDDRARRSGTAGIGVELGHRHGVVYIKSVLADGPAADADLRPGDQILRIDGHALRHQSITSTAALLAGPDGSVVQVTVKGRDGAMGDVSVTRASIPPETVFAEKQDDLLVLRISGFSRDTDDRLANELTRHLTPTSKISGIIVDLRGNRGGLLRQAADAVSRFLDQGLIATTDGRDPQAVHEFRAVGGDMTGGRPLVVVVDGRSASAAEIMAAALADNSRAVVVGSSTLGKGLVQTITPLPDEGELFVTWSRVLAPLGWPLQGLGVMPQVCTSLGLDELQKQLEELSRGIQPMHEALTRARTARAPIPTPMILELRAPCPAAVGRDEDMIAARFLALHAEAYKAALLNSNIKSAAHAP